MGHPIYRTIFRLSSMAHRSATLSLTITLILASFYLNMAFPVTTEIEEYFNPIQREVNKLV